MTVIALCPLSTADVELLAGVRHARDRHTGTQPPYNGYLRDARDRRRAHWLVRQGYLKRTQFSEHVRGETRIYWWAFYLTDLGRTVLARRGR